MKKHIWLAILTALILTLGCTAASHAEIIPPYGPGQQIGYPAVVLCETLSLRESPNSYSRAIQTLFYGETPIVVGADRPVGPMEENGFVYVTLGDSEDSPTGWINSDYLIINPSWYVTEGSKPVFAWNVESIANAVMGESHFCLWGERYVQFNEDAADLYHCRRVGGDDGLYRGVLYP
jgi:hypothetical protein